MSIDWVKLSEAIPYAGTAIVFGLFMVIVLRLIFSQLAAWQLRQDAKDERRDKDWREFLTQQQTLRGEQWAGVAAELRVVATALGANTDLLRSHDAWERGLLAQMQNRRSDDLQYLEGTEK